MPEKKCKYECTFHFDGVAGLQRKYAIVPSIMDVKDGFWVNDDLKYTTASDNRYWIPPSQILCVRKDWYKS